MTSVMFVKPLRHETLDRTPQKFVPMISEETFRLRVDEHDSPLGVDDNHCVGADSRSARKFFSALSGALKRRCGLMDRLSPVLGFAGPTYKNPLNLAE